MSTLTFEEIKKKAFEVIEEEGDDTKAFLKKYIDEIAKELVDHEIDSDDTDAFIDYFQNEIEKYDEYLDIE
jgi:hypothetical protein